MKYEYKTKKQLIDELEASETESKRVEDSMQERSKQTDEELKKRNKELEILNKEIHHRVKNNLQVIASLLKLQSGYIKDNKALLMFKESQNRVKSMTLIHEQLYDSKVLGWINCTEYIRNLVNHLIRSFRLHLHKIKLNINVNDIFLDIDTANSCGLIINELVSNSLKHAFPAGKEDGEIRIDLHSDNDNKFILIVSDNGVGFPKDIDFRNTKSLGLQLVNTLIEQLDGTIELYSSGGTAFEIAFPTKKTQGNELKQWQMQR